MTREEAIEVLQSSSIKQMSLTKIIVNGKALSVKTALEMAIEALRQEPKSGHWKAVPYNSKHGEYRPNKYACSECGWEIDLCRGLQQDTGHRLFCEHCGADMRGEE